MGTEKVKAIELVLDWNLWPRQSAQVLDITNLNRMKSALRAGFQLPPVIVNRADMRIVDGFHRTTAMIAIFGDDADIDVEFRDYKKESDIFLDAGMLNCRQGLTMSPKDRAHFILRCRKMKIPPAKIAAALSIDPKAMAEFIQKRSATTQTGEVIPLSAGATNLAGKTLTTEQEHYARTANGCVPEMYVSMLLNALRADTMVMKEKTIAKMQELYDVIGRILEEAA